MLLFPQHIVPGTNCIVNMAQETNLNANIQIGCRRLRKVDGNKARRSDHFSYIKEALAPVLC